MKFTITFKTPDVVDAIVDSVALDDHELSEHSDDVDCDDAVQKKKDLMLETVEKFVEYGEYVAIEFDTDAGTAQVVEAKKRR